jgi:hypothetical protein
MPTIYMLGMALTNNVTLASWAQLLVAVTVIAMAFRMFSRPLHPALCLAVFATATFLVTPYAFVYDLPILSMALVALVVSLGKPLHTGALLIYLLVWLLTPMQLQFHVGGAILLLFFVYLKRLASLPEYSHQSQPI